MDHLDGVEQPSPASRVARRADEAGRPLDPHMLVPANGLVDGRRELLDGLHGASWVPVPKTRLGQSAVGRAVRYGVTYGGVQHVPWRRLQRQLDDRHIQIQMPGLWLHGFQPANRRLRVMQGTAACRLDVHGQGARATRGRVCAYRQDPCRHGSRGRAPGRGEATPPGRRWVTGPLRSRQSATTRRSRTSAVGCRANWFCEPNFRAILDLYVTAWKLPMWVYLKPALVAAAIVIGSTSVWAVKAPSAADVVYARSDLDVALAPAHNRAEFEAWSAHHSSPDENPFLRLSPGAQHRFVESLDSWAMAHGGAPDTADIEAELTLSQAVRLLAVIGRQTIGVHFMPDIRVESSEDRVADAWRKAVLGAGGDE